MKILFVLLLTTLNVAAQGSCHVSLRESYLERRIYDSKRFLTCWCRYTLNQQLGLSIWTKGSATRFYRDVLPAKYSNQDRFGLMITNAAIEDRRHVLTTLEIGASVEYSAYDRRTGKQFYLEVSEGRNGSIYTKELIGFLDERCF